MKTFAYLKCAQFVLPFVPMTSYSQNKGYLIRDMFAFLTRLCHARHHSSNQSTESPNPPCAYVR